MIHIIEIALSTGTKTVAINTDDFETALILASKNYEGKAFSSIQKIEMLSPSNTKIEITGELEGDVKLFCSENGIDDLNHLVARALKHFMTIAPGNL